MTMKSLIAISAVLAALALHQVVAAPADEVDCTKVDEMLDDYGTAQGFNTLSTKYKFPTTPEEYTSRCKEMKDAIKTLRKYNQKCFSQLTQQVFSAILRTRAAHNEAHCDVNSPEGKAAFEGIKCLSEQSQDGIKDAEMKLILYSQALLDKNIPDEQLRLRNACCAMQDGQKAVLDQMVAKCPSHTKLYKGYMDSYASEAMGLICADTEKLQCDKLERLKLDGIEPKSKFFFNPMLKVVKTLDH